MIYATTAMVPVSIDHIQKTWLSQKQLTGLSEHDHFCPCTLMRSFQTVGGPTVSSRFNPASINFCPFALNTSEWTFSTTYIRWPSQLKLHFPSPTFYIVLCIHSACIPWE